MADDRAQVAVDVIARRAIGNAAGAQGMRVEWSDYPELTDDQWSAVCARIEEIVAATNPSEDEFVAAYEFLTGETP